MREGEIICKGARITHCSSAARKLASLLACHLSPRFCPKQFAPLAWQGRESRVERASDRRHNQPTAAQFNRRAGLLHGGMRRTAVSHRAHGHFDCCACACVWPLPQLHGVCCRTSAATISVKPTPHVMSELGEYAWVEHRARAECVRSLFCMCAILYRHLYSVRRHMRRPVVWRLYRRLYEYRQKRNVRCFPPPATSQSRFSVTPLERTAMLRHRVRHQASNPGLAEPRAAN